MGLSRSGWLLTALAALGLLWNLGRLDLWAPDEPRLAQVAEELLTGELGRPGTPGEAGPRGAERFALLHLAGEPYTQKPPLYYWLAALVGAPGGHVSEWAARLPSALAGIASVALCIALGRSLFTPQVGLLAGAVLLTTHRFWWIARRAQLDGLLGALELIAVLAFWRIESDIGSRTRMLALLHAALGLAALVKGPVAWLPMLGFVAYRLWQRDVDGARQLLAPRWLLLSLGPVLVWIGAATALGPPGFFGEAVVENVIGRVVSGTSHVRPLTYYLIQLPADFMPWSLALPAAGLALRRGLVAERARSQGGDHAPAPWRLLAAWFFTALVVLSLAAGKRGLYLLPFFPALAIASAAALDRLVTDDGHGWSVAEGAIRWLLAGLALGLAAWCMTGGIDLRPAAQVTLAPALLLSGSLACLTALALGSFALRAPRQRLWLAVGALIALHAATDAALSALDGEKSPRPVALAAGALARPGGPIGVFGERALIGGLLYYGKHPVYELADAGAARAFAAQHGGPLIVSSRRLARLDPDGRLHVRGRLRSGRRELLIVEQAR